MKLFTNCIWCRYFKTLENNFQFLNISLLAEVLKFLTNGVFNGFIFIYSTTLGITYFYPSLGKTHNHRFYFNSRSFSSLGFRIAQLLAPRRPLKPVRRERKTIGAQVWNFGHEVIYTQVIFITCSSSVMKYALPFLYRIYR